MGARRTSMAVVAGLGLALALSACSSPDPAEANAAFCDANAVAQAEADALISILGSGAATVDEVRARAKKLGEATSDAYDRAGDLASSVQDEIETADKAFAEAVQAIPGDATVQEAKSEYVAAVNAWDASVDAVRAEIGCS